MAVDLPILYNLALPMATRSIKLFRYTRRMSAWQYHGAFHKDIDKLHMIIGMIR